MEIKSISLSVCKDIETPDKKTPNISMQDHAQDEVKNVNGQANKPTDKVTQLKTAIDTANAKMKFTKTRCEFKYHEDINRVSIKVIDRETDVVIREIPPEETIDLIHKLWEMAGIIVDEKR